MSKNVENYFSPPIKNAMGTLTQLLEFGDAFLLISLYSFFVTILFAPFTDYFLH